MRSLVGLGLTDRRTRIVAVIRTVIRITDSFNVNRYYNSIDLPLIVVSSSKSKIFVCKFARHETVVHCQYMALFDLFRFAYRKPSCTKTRPPLLFAGTIHVRLFILWQTHFSHLLTKNSRDRQKTKTTGWRFVWRQTGDIVFTKYARRF